MIVIYSSEDSYTKRHYIEKLLPSLLWIRPAT